MKSSDVAHARLTHQLIIGSRASRCAQVAASLGAMQAQDDGSVLWALGLRTPGATLASVEAEIADGSVVRSWFLRGTLHVAAADDVRWLLRLVAPRLLRMRQPRREALALDAKSFLRCEKALLRALSGKRLVTREQALQLFAEAGVPPDGQRGYHVLSHLALEGLICFGPNQGNQHTFVLLDEWVPAQKPISDEEAAVRLAARYVQSRAPFSTPDFAWWSGLPAALVKVGLAEVAPPETERAPTSRTLHAQLLPGFDEYLLGYKDRTAVLPAEHASKVVPGSNGVFLPCLVLNGQVLGTWKRVLGKKQARITLAPFGKLDARALKAIEHAAEAYGAFLGLPVTIN